MRAPGIERSRAAHVDVEAGVGRGHLDVERLVGRRRAPRRSPRRPRSRRRGRAPGSGSGRSPRCGARAAPRSRPRARRRAPRRACSTRRRRPCAMRIDQIADRRRDPGLAPARRPRGRASRRDMRRSAQCCMAQPPHGRNAGRSARCARALACSTSQQMRRSGWPADRLDLDGLARQRIRHDRPAQPAVGDAVAAMAEARDGEAFSHVAAPIRNSRLPSPPAIGDRDDAGDAPAERRDEAPMIAGRPPRARPGRARCPS